MFNNKKDFMRLAEAYLGKAKLGKYQYRKSLCSQAYPKLAILTEETAKSLRHVTLAILTGDMKRMTKGSPGQQENLSI
jgi:hypothetical protein